MLKCTNICILKNVDETPQISFFQRLTKFVRLQKIIKKYCILLTSFIIFKNISILFIVIMVCSRKTHIIYKIFCTKTVCSVM